MTERYCDHQYFEVIRATAPKDTEYTDNVFIVIVCHYCGHRKEVWADGTIRELKKNVEQKA